MKALISSVKETKWLSDILFFNLEVINPNSFILFPQRHFFSCILNKRLLKGRYLSRGFAFKLLFQGYTEKKDKTIV